MRKETRSYSGPVKDWQLALSGVCGFPIKQMTRGIIRMAEERLYSAREAAKLIGISELAVHRLLRQHNAPKVLNVYALPMAFIERLNKQRSASSAPTKKRGGVA